MALKAHDILLGHLCSSRDCQLAYCWLSRCCAVCPAWQKAVRKYLSTLHVLDFCGHEAQVAGTDVLCALVHVAGTNLHTLDLGGCQGISGEDMTEILRVVRMSCRSVKNINVMACQDKAHLRAAVIGAQSHYGCASPRELFEHLQVQREEGTSHFPWADLCAILLPHLRLDPNFDPGPAALLEAVQACSAWDVALLLGVSFIVDDGEIHDDAESYSPSSDEGQTRIFDCNKPDRSHIPTEGGRCPQQLNRRPIHAAAERGDEEMMAVLVSARANLDPEDRTGATPLLAACAAGHLAIATILVKNGANINISKADREGTTPLLAAFEAGHLQLAKMLVEERADVSKADLLGNTPLLACIGCRRVDLALAQMLVQKGANAQTIRQDFAGILSIAIFSQNGKVVKFAFEHGPRRFEGQGTSDGTDDIAQFAQSFLDPRNMGGWLRNGASPSGLIDEIRACRFSEAVDQPMKNQLDKVRAFIEYHIYLLRDTSRWPVAHCVEQLASQEPAFTFRPAPTAAQTCADLGKTPAIIEWVSTTHSLLAPHCKVKAVVFCPDGSRLASAQETQVVVCDARTGFVESILSREEKLPGRGPTFE